MLLIPYEQYFNCYMQQKALATGTNENVWLSEVTVKS
jgi:hypothetical protein